MSFFHNLPALLSTCACQHPTSWPRVGSVPTRAAPYACCSLSFTVLTIVCHVWDLEPSGAVPLIGLKLNPQPLGSGGEGDGAFIGLAGFIRCHRIGWSCQGKLEGMGFKSPLSLQIMDTHLFRYSCHRTSHVQGFFRTSGVLRRDWKSRTGYLVDANGDSGPQGQLTARLLAGK